MSWIKKLLKKMKQDDIEMEEYIEQQIDVSKSQFNLFEQNDVIKDVEARIAYHYPKGAIHLSLFQDEKEDKVSRRKKLEKERIHSSIPPYPESMEREDTWSTEDMYPSNRKIEKNVVSKRPFRPTEIPSPIYGYERPKKSIFLDYYKDEKPVNNIVSSKPTELEVKKTIQQNHPFEIPNKEIQENNITLSEIVMDDQKKEHPIMTEGEIQKIKTKSIEKRDTRKRTSIPFNVIMLNQDRMNLEKKRYTPKNDSDNTEKHRYVSVEKEKSQQPSAVSVPIVESSLQNMKQKEEQWREKEELLPHYVFPSINCLSSPIPPAPNKEWLNEQEQLLNNTLINFNVKAKVVNVTQGPSVTRFEVQPEPGVKVNKITNLSDDIKLSLAARDIRIEAPIPGKHTIGIEVPNQTSRPVFIREIIYSEEFSKNDSPLTVALGFDISGKPIVTDLRKMPHGLIAGSTGSGKSVCINTMLVSLLYKANPDELKLLLIDPKMVELAPYNYIPHLVSPVITDVKAATAALKWAVEEMERRYELFAHTGVRDISRFNTLAEENKQYNDKLPYIVIIIDELADLMMMSPADVEEAICRIAQKARACGIHLIIATQRPSVDVITGLIKANVPTRIAFSVSSQIDSRTIIDISGAEKLLGKGDMLFLENGSNKPVRLQGTFVSDSEIDAVVQHVRRERNPEYLFEQEELLKKAQIIEEEDELFYEACEFIIDQGGASTSSLQRRFKIGYNRAARLIDLMEKQGFISEARGSKPRDVLITESELEEIQYTSSLN